ncbi:hypothetical protein [Fredinandcohnia quinoae]|uniref:Uncharacterized protein n=1 Tax=Fredinandcohnia quinoae TaxID=2918902 RepID=A0AAW5EBC0_9BACI|nr:hypothetical protein [Fredinandcohnia sp. SECRCQ15]MCH1626965.1 hypothetical protein [Fredinandcohnia sp. SECRCQ15]
MNNFHQQMHVNPYFQNTNPGMDDSRPCCGQQWGNPQIPFQGPVQQPNFGSFEMSPNAMDPSGSNMPQMGFPMMGNMNNNPHADWQFPNNQVQPNMIMGCGCGHGHHIPHGPGCGCGHHMPHGHGAHHHHMHMGQGPNWMGR